MKPASTVPCSVEKTASSLPVIDLPTPEHQSFDLLTELLTQQQTLTAVDQFARAHDAGPPAQSKYYSRLLPAAPPEEGQQYAFEVDLDRCSGCKACVTACHSLNGLDEGETWRDVGLLIGGTSAEPAMQHVTTACHHCLEPACMEACPVDAYEKDSATGIVKHLDDQCFGCQYCTLACPYDVPSYHAGKGIVRKCDMCSDRLAVGEAPACVQACPHEAISINVVDVDQVRENAEADPFLPAAPEPSLTLPTTHFKTSRVFPRNMLPADYRSVNPQHPHWPLIIMLVLTQLSVGAFAVGMLLETKLPADVFVRFQPVQAILALAFGLVALAASTAHLGRPQYAFRAIVGLRHSWLSREIVAFGIFAAAAASYAAIVWFVPNARVLANVSGWTTVVTGVIAVFCSAMIYAFTKREFWCLSRVFPRFVLTSAILGIAATWLSILLLGQALDSEIAGQVTAEVGPLLLRWLLIAAIAKLIFEAAVLRHLASRRTTPMKRTAMLMNGALIGSTLARFALGVLGGVFMPLLLLDRLAGTPSPIEPVSVTVMVAMILMACFVGESLERFQFFAAVSPPRMPGNIRR